MACVRGMHRDRRKNGHCYIHHPEVLYIYVFYDTGLAGDHLLIRRILDEYQAVYPQCKEEPVKAPVALVPSRGNEKDSYEDYFVQKRIGKM